jgi:hypothetical protein
MMTIDELQRLAADFRALHKANGVIIVTFEAGQTLFGFSFNDVDREALSKGAAPVLKEIARKIEDDLMNKSVPAPSGLA